MIISNYNQIIYADQVRGHSMKTNLNRFWSVQGMLVEDKIYLLQTVNSTNSENDY